MPVTLRTLFKKNRGGSDPTPPRRSWVKNHPKDSMQGHPHHRLKYFYYCVAACLIHCDVREEKTEQVDAGDKRSGQHQGKAQQKLAPVLGAHRLSNINSHVWTIMGSPWFIGSQRKEW